MQKPNTEAKVYNNYKKYDWEKKKSSKALLDFTVPIKLIATTEEGKESRE